MNQAIINLNKNGGLVPQRRRNKMKYHVINKNYEVQSSHETRELAIEAQQKFLTLDVSLISSTDLTNHRLWESTQKLRQEKFKLRSIKEEIKTLKEEIRLFENYLNYQEKQNDPQ